MIANTPKISIVLMILIPAAAMAHGPGGHPPDPNLHVDGSLEECEVHFAPELTQASFGRFVREFGSVSAFKLMAPPTTLGQWGVSIGIEYMAFGMDDKSDAWNDTFAHPDTTHELGSSQEFPKLKLRVGVSEKVDVGAFFTKHFNANYGWVGVDVKYRLLEQTDRMPISLALRGAYTKTLFVSDMDMHAGSFEVAAGRTFWGVLTPYLALGTDMVVARETSDTVDLHHETEVVPHAIAGLEVKYWHLAFGAEANLGTLTSYQVQVAGVF